MNVYDFDGTIYHGDSTRDFYFFSIKRNILLLRFLPRQSWAFLKYALKIITKTQFKEKFYVFLTGIKNIDSELKLFWETHEKNMKKWYLNSRQPDDLIISASPEFLLEPMAKNLNFALMASRVNKHTGETTGENCWGEEKVRRFKEIYNETPIISFFSDSLSDSPLAKKAQTAYFVKGENLIPWQTVQGA